MLIPLTIIRYFMYGTDLVSTEVRNMIVTHIVQNWELFCILMSHDENGENYTDSANYLSEMSKSSISGGLCELYAASQIFDHVFRPN